jgi:hypothetical protein
MKFIGGKNNFIEHKKNLRTFKINKKMANKAKVTLTVSDKLVIDVHGFIRVMDCQTIELGSLVLPYVLWIRVLKIIEDTPEDEIEITGENGRLYVGNVEISGPTIGLCPVVSSETENAPH